MLTLRRIFVVIVLALLVAACAPSGSSGTSSTPTPASNSTVVTTTPNHVASTPTHVGTTPQASATAKPGASPTPVVDTSPLTCAANILGSHPDANCQTPRSLRVAYGVESLMQRGYTGSGQTVVDIVSFGSPILQRDMNIFDQQFGLPPIAIQVIAPIGTAPFNPANKLMQGWAVETELDVQIIHAIAPGAHIVVLTSPVAEVEGTTGLPQFLQLEQYAINHHLGSIISQSFGASEATLKDSASQQQIQQWDAFYKQATTQQGMTFLGASGDNGATDFTDANASVLATTPTTSFPTDDPWVTSTGGTTLDRTQNGFAEMAWNNSLGASGGGFSAFFSTPSYQQSLSTVVQQLLNKRRGVPDVAADADPNTGL
ncbi:MAG TPA: S53 family peptidase, partial [Ktedonobacteraceae bacterium]|nr:S53 family peptidase [Ktedonobacteraceae bacterium]